MRMLLDWNQVKKGKMKKPKYVEVSWVDAWSNAHKTYEDGETIDERGLLTISVGLLLSSTKEGVTIAQSKTQNEPTLYNRHILFVPKGIIVKIRNLK